MMTEEIRAHLIKDIIPFWKSLRDEEYGGFYGLVDQEGNVDKKAEKGCILNSRITWFFSNAYLLLGDEALLEEAKHGYEFLKKYCIDYEYGGVFWSMSYAGIPLDTTKHTYNQAFAIYALASYYDASKDEEAKKLAFDLVNVIETKCTDEIGYKEAGNREFGEILNDKLSENGVIADRTMNTFLHIMEAYTELYRVTMDEKLADRLKWILDQFAKHVYNPELHRQEVFFDKEYHSILDLHSYGHDIETAWLMDRTIELLGDPEYEAKMSPITKALTAEIYRVAFDGRSLPYECEKGIVNQERSWWVQAETVIGFLNGYQKDPSKQEYLEAAENTWNFIKTYQIIPQVGEWYDTVEKDGTPKKQLDIVQPWKCPYHNGRMCMEVMKRLEK